MNNYQVTKCSKCGQVVVSSVVGSVKVAGWRNLEAVFNRLKSGEDMKTIAEDFCEYCLCPKSSHLPKDEYEKQGAGKDWVPWHEFQPQSSTFC